MRLHAIMISTVLAATTPSAIAETYVGFGIGSAAYQVDLSAYGGG